MRVKNDHRSEIFQLLKLENFTAMIILYFPLIHEDGNM